MERRRSPFEHFSSPSNDLCQPFEVLELTRAASVNFKAGTKFGPLKVFVRSHPDERSTTMFDGGVSRQFVSLRKNAAGWLNTAVRIAQLPPLSAPPNRKPISEFRARKPIPGDRFSRQRKTFLKASCATYRTLSETDERSAAVSFGIWDELEQ